MTKRARPAISEAMGGTDLAGYDPDDLDDSWADVSEELWGADEYTNPFDKIKPERRAGRATASGIRADEHDDDARDTTTA
jgi:hypothetical protein